jgi:gluconate 2-dehydrogenase subunit 3-like protein
VRTKRTGITPGKGEAHFPGYDVLDQASTWDATTTQVVLGRLQPPAPAVPQFFSDDEEGVVRELLDRVLAQDEEPRVPVFEVIDQRLAEGQADGYRYEDMPDDGEAWRLSVIGLDKDARECTGVGFAAASRRVQRDIIERIRLCDGSWHGMPAQRVFSLWMRYACSAFYAHPWAWNEIGFGGPAYPRGYKHLALDGREDWEVGERDAHDPIPWVERAEAARKRHASGMSQRENEETEEEG